jgi:hypothetical protein
LQFTRKEVNTIQYSQRLSISGGGKALAIATPNYTDIKPAVLISQVV